MFVVDIHIRGDLSFLQVLPQHIFKSRDPIVMGVMVENGIVKVGTPICVPSKSVSIFCNLFVAELKPLSRCFVGQRRGLIDWVEITAKWKFKLTQVM